MGNRSNSRGCARNARISSNKEVARELWKMAQEYQAEVASLDQWQAA